MRTKDFFRPLDSESMAEICCSVVSDSEVSEPCEPMARAARRRRIEIRRFRLAADVAAPLETYSFKRQRIDGSLSPPPARELEKAVETPRARAEVQAEAGSGVALAAEEKPDLNSTLVEPASFDPSYGITSVCGRRREMEDAVSIHPSFCRPADQNPATMHFFGVFDGHGCSHVATSCKDRMHELLAEELEKVEMEATEWKEAMVRTFLRMDKEVSTGEGNDLPEASCRCERRSPQCDAVGSTAVVAVVATDKIVVGNCGDSRAVLCRNGKPVPLTSDHKPDRPDELQRIEAAGGRVIYWDGARVLGVLAMSRAIGDTYLKPLVISEPEVTVTERTPGDEFLILASDGLWDVLSNSMACDIVRMCLSRRAPANPSASSPSASSSSAFSDAALLLTKLALARQSGDNISVVVVDLCTRDT